MSLTAPLPRLTAGGIELDTGPEAFGFLRDSSDVAHDPVALHARMEEDGYLYLPGFLDREDVRDVRRRICDVLAEEGLLDPTLPSEDAIAASDAKVAFRPDIVSRGAPREALERVIYGDRVMAFYSDFLGGEAAHFDYTWLRAVAPGKGTYPHCDVVFMGRGTKNLYTAWVPLGDVPLEAGGLIVVEGSHKDEATRQGYATMDVDTVCENKPGSNPLKEAGLPGFGELGSDMRAVRNRLGGRILTAKEFRMGDLLTFSVYTVHGSLDNGSNQIRLSSDSRYQLASEPMDERWVGENPPGHGGNSVRGLIC
ncbi:phytanoyl-CoA dioxygenase family protein [soil metagenome]